MGYNTSSLITWVLILLYILGSNGLPAHNSNETPTPIQTSRRKTCAGPEDAVHNLISNTDYNFLVDVLTSCSYKERLKIKEYALDTLGIKLKAWFRGNEPNSVILRYLLSNHSEIYVDAIHDTIVNDGNVIMGLKLPTHVLALLLTTLPNDLKPEVRQLYFDYYRSDLKHAISDKYYFTAEKLLQKLVVENRKQEQLLSNDQVDQIAEKLYHSGEEKLGTDDAFFIKVFTTESLPDLVRIFDKYHEKYGSSIRRALEMLVARHELIEWTMILCNEIVVRSDAISAGRVMILRSGRDLKFIRQLYPRICFSRSLEDDIQKYLSKVSYPLLRLLERPENLP